MLMGKCQEIEEGFEAACESRARLCGAGHMLDGVVHAGALGRWQSLVPTWPEGAKALRKWKKEKPSAGSTASFLQAAYLARGQVEANWAQAQTWRGDDSSSAENTESNEENPWGRYGRDNADSMASSSTEMPKSKSRMSKKIVKQKKDSSSTEKKKSKKKSKKRTPKDKKHRKATSSSDAVSKLKKHKKSAEVSSSDEDRNPKKHQKPADADNEKKEDQKSNVEPVSENANDANMESETK